MNHPTIYQTYHRCFLLLLRLNLFAVILVLRRSLTRKHSHDAFLWLGGRLRRLMSTPVHARLFALRLWGRSSLDFSRLLQLHRGHGHCPGTADRTVPADRRKKVGTMQNVHKDWYDSTDVSLFLTMDCGWVRLFTSNHFTKLH